MVVTYFGAGCFRLQSGEISILIDSENNRLKADVLLNTSVPAAENLAGEPGGEVRISFPGEYEAKGVEVVGFPVTQESNDKLLKTAYAVSWEEMKFVFLGSISSPLDASLMEEFSEPDVLFLPVGGGKVLEPEVAAKITKQLEARVVFPSFSKNPADFLKALGKKSETAEKFVFKKKDIATDKGRVVVLKEN